MFMSLANVSEKLTMLELKLRDKQNCSKASKFLFILPIFRCKMESNCLKNGLKFFLEFFRCKISCLCCKDKHHGSIHFKAFLS